MRRGFTLTEIAIVLGIIGLILGAIWVAAEGVYCNTNPNEKSCLARHQQAQQQRQQAQQQVQQQSAPQDAVTCKPEKVSQTPDGVILWKVSRDCSKVDHDVYFSTKGTSNQVGRGQISTVPNDYNTSAGE